LVAANYRPPVTVAEVRIDCPVTKGFHDRTSTCNVKGLEQERPPAALAGGVTVDEPGHVPLPDETAVGAEPYLVAHLLRLRSM
jgi:hypothetical protein